MPVDLASNCLFVLVEPSHPGNIGAAARAMKTMGLHRLALIRPKHYPSADATARAAGADDVLGRARVYDDLASALVECTLVIGTTARKRSSEWPLYTPEQAAAAVEPEVRQGGTVAVIFGRENSGLNNEELAHCHGLLSIPVNPDFQSLNLGAAVQLIAYILRREIDPVASQPEGASESEFAPQAEADAWLQRLDDIMQKTGYLDLDHPGLVRFHLRRWLTRSRPTAKEIRMLHGVLRAIERHL